MDKKEKEIPTIEDMKKEALKFAESIPNLKEKHQWMTEIRGNVIEFSIIIEESFNEIITRTGKELVFNHEKEELYLIAGIRTKKDLPGFTTKSRDMKKLIEKIFPELEEVSKSNLLDAFKKFEAIRDIFAHVPINWRSSELEFDDNPPYYHFFYLNHKWKNVFAALSEFMSIHKWIIDVILTYNRHILLSQELYSRILLGKSFSAISEEAKKSNTSVNEKKSP
ncbi:MAG: hypothetical protein NTW17_00035 [Candidatus Pacearchaeota archaeon]|nr:hypothetical protein [Candidatus Pacearchaeota archaeon]